MSVRNRVDCPKYHQLVSKKGAKSSVWRYFGIPGDENGKILNEYISVCMICKSPVSAKATSNLRSHLKCHHPRYHNLIVTTQPSTEPDVVEVFNDQDLQNVKIESVSNDAEFVTAFDIDDVDDDVESSEHQSERETEKEADLDARAKKRKTVQESDDITVYSSEKRPPEKIYRQSDEESPIDLFFKCMAVSVKTLSLERQIRAKILVSQLIGNLELEEISSKYSSLDSSKPSSSLVSNLDITSVSKDLVIK